MRSNGKGQVTTEVIVIMFYLIVVLQSVWLAGPIQQSTEKSVDTNGLILAKTSLETLAENVKKVGVSGAGAKSDFVVHVPFNTVDIRYNDGTYELEGSTYNGPHMNFTVLSYYNLDDGSLEDYFVAYDSTDPASHADPAWMSDEEPKDTFFFYKNVTVPLSFPLTKMPLCDPDARKVSEEMRGQDTLFRDVAGKYITFCCDAGFNLYLFAQKSEGGVAIKPRFYYSTAGDWRIS